jgi:transcriptional regulator with XRE-family HTH domain
VEKSAYLRAVGRAVKTVRTEHGLTQEALSLEAKTHRNHISAIELGKRQASIITIAKLAAAIGVQPSEIYRIAERLLAEGTIGD